MIIKYITFGISVSFLSWIIGMIINSILIKTPYYQRLSNLNIIKNQALNKKIGLGAFKWIVKNTPFKYFNPKLKLQPKAGTTELNELRKEMTFSEISHFIGFGFVTIFAVIKLINSNYLFALIIMLVNVLMNLYPSLLQQENKRRIDRFIKISRQRI